MVAPAPSTACWQTAGSLVLPMVVMAGQAAPGTQVDPEFRPMRVEAAPALEDKGRQDKAHLLLLTKVVTAARALNRPYLVPLIITEAAAAAAPTSAPLAMGDWVAVDQAMYLEQAHLLTRMVLRVQPSQGAEVVVVDIRLKVVQAALASSSSATRRKAPARRR